LNNKHRITLASFLAYFVMSGMLAPMGIISGEMSEHFGLPVTEITARFGWLTIGILTGAIIALVIFDWIRLRKLLMLVYAIILACLSSLVFLGNIKLIGLALGVVGACCGVGLAGAALVISRTYETEVRASMLVITDGSFSVAGIVCSWIAIFLIAREYHWSGVYQFVALIAALIVLLSSLSTFPATDVDDHETSGPEKWPFPVWLCIVSLFLYTLGQWAFLLWLPNYAETELGAPREQAGQLVSQFWTGMFAAQIFVAWWVLKVGVRRLVLIAAVCTSLLSIPLWVFGDIDVLIILATLWGFANLSLLKVVLSFATQMLRRPTARLVSSLLLGATIGTASSPWLTSQIVAATNAHFVLQFGTGCYVVLTILLLSASRLYRTSELRVAQQSGA
jgi:TsgA-like MFS transporter